MDFADGSACVFGSQPYSGEDLGRGGLYADVLSGLGVPVFDLTAYADVLFLCCSGVLVERGLRLDCGCLKVGDSEDFCDALLDDIFADACDVDYCVPITDKLSISAKYLDGEIPSMFELVGSS